MTQNWGNGTKEDGVFLRGWKGVKKKNAIGGKKEEDDGTSPKTQKGVVGGAKNRRGGFFS